MTALTDGQYDVDGFLMGAGTPYVVRTFEDGGAPGRRVGDVPNAYDAGVAWGRDQFEGMSLVYDVLVETAGGVAAWDAAQAMVRAWRGDSVRDTPQAQQIARVKRPGAATRRAYGRSRKCTPVRSRNTGVGLVPVAATFECADDRWYADAPTSVTLGIVPATTGGLITTPGHGLTAPLTTAAASDRPGVLNNPGDLDTWPVLTFTGPVASPSVELLVGGARRWMVELDTTIPEGVTVTVDTHPWARTVLRDDGATVKRTVWSTPLRRCVVPPGQSSIVFRGTSSSGTGTVGVVYRAAYASY
jgi:hypothetical protein